MKKLTSALALFLSLVLMLSITTGRIPVAAGADTNSSSLSNPSIDKNGVATWDCVYFGNYQHIDEESEEPIKWRVLSVDGSDAFLMADRILAEHEYAAIEDIGEEDDDPVFTWETCALRRWLNEDFYQSAFSQEEQAAILTSTVVNEDNADTGMDAGNDTEDKIYLLSVDEVGKAEYGFDTDLDKESETRKVESGDVWWLRTPCNNDDQAVVKWDGAVNRTQAGLGTYIYSESGVRPVLHLNLDNTSVWSKANSVKSSTEATTTEKVTTTEKTTATEKPTSTEKTTATEKPNTTAGRPASSEKGNTSTEKAASSEKATTTEAQAVTKRTAPKTKMKPGEKKAISSFKDLQAMEDIPSGSYYLKKDITVPKNARIFCDYPFTGTLDGRGHKIKGYQFTNAIVSGPLKKDNIFNELENSAWQVSDSHVGIFDQASKATFKNISVTNVKINVKTDCCAYVGALVTSADSCTFSNVHVSGKITVNSTRENPTNKDFFIGGIASSSSKGKMVNCSNSAAITVNCRNGYDGGSACVGGLAGYITFVSLLKNCSNSGNISLSGYGSGGGDLSAAGLLITYNYTHSTNGNIKSKMISCTNSGNITVKAYAKKKKYDTPAYNVGDHYPIACDSVYAVGLVNYVDSVISCGNTGKIKASVQFEDTKKYVAGVVGRNSFLASRCYNKGAISLTGAGPSEEAAIIGGVFSVGPNAMSECYNTGKVSVKATKKSKGRCCCIGGVAGRCVSMYGKKLTNCYNAGTVSVSGSGAVIGGICGAFETWSGYARYNYNAGTVKASHKGAATASIFGDAGSAEILDSRRHTYDNYYKGSVEPYGIHASWKDWKPLAKKVSSITSANCPKLSSKYWVYSPKVKRMVLKNNNETKVAKKAKKK